MVGLLGQDGGVREDPEPPGQVQSSGPARDRRDRVRVGFDTSRVTTLVDGIFAIAMTLLVLGLKDAHAAGTWAARLRALEPGLFAYVISFLILGLYWTGHHAEFHYICRTNRLHLWLNMLAMMMVALIPFSASVLAEPDSGVFGVALYSANLVLVSAAFFAQWSYATSGRRLVARDLDRRIVRDVKSRLIISTCLLVGAIAASLWSRPASFLLYLAVQSFYILRTTRSATGVPPDIEP
jgi:uncharacterized membrane protein